MHVIIGVQENDFDWGGGGGGGNAFVHVFTLQVRFLNPKLHVRLVLEKWAWQIRALPEICYNLA